MNEKRATRETLQFVRELQLPAHDYAIFGSGPLLARGIIDAANDIDILCRGAAWARVRQEGDIRRLDKYGLSVVEFLEGLVSFGTEWGIGSFDVDELIDTAETIDGLPFARLEHVIAYKRIADRPKDALHLRALEAHGYAT